MVWRRRGHEIEGAGQSRRICQFVELGQRCPPLPALGERLQQPPPLLTPVWSPSRRTHGLVLILAAFENQLFSVHSKLRFSRVENQILSRARLVGVFGTGLHGTGALALARILTKGSKSVFGLKR